MMENERLTVGKIEELTKPADRLAKESEERLTAPKDPLAHRPHLTTQSIQHHRERNDELRTKGSRENYALYSLHSVAIDILEELRYQSAWARERAGGSNADSPPRPEKVRAGED
jgi:hypothetical protein